MDELRDMVRQPLAPFDSGDVSGDDLRNAGDGLMVIRERLILEGRSY